MPGRVADLWGRKKPVDGGGEKWGGTPILKKVWADSGGIQLFGGRQVTLENCSKKGRGQRDSKCRGESKKKKGQVGGKKSMQR